MDFCWEMVGGALLAGLWCFFLNTTFGTAHAYRRALARFVGEAYFNRKRGGCGRLHAFSLARFHKLLLHIDNKHNRIGLSLDYSVPRSHLAKSWLDPLLTDVVKKLRSFFL